MRQNIQKQNDSKALGFSRYCFSQGQCFSQFSPV